MPTTLITGANKGLGFETARQLAAAGHTVYIGSRNDVRGQAAATELGVRAIQIDVTDDASVDAAARTIDAAGGLDVLVNCAGIEERTPDGGLLGAADLTSVDRPEYAYAGVAYPASKTALNMLTVQYAKAFPSIRVNSVDPGFTATDLNRHTGTQTVEEGAEIIVRMAQVGPDGPTGGYFSAAGPLPW
ncbi:SDR family NAD(P)-dependent oxidoreductase [Prescottella soli]|uniref:SDR family NAD(P)-dependent oxidoreductase n=1 Tax=Prescottella soli TaxID=1543852 RepID=A0ABW9G2I7_9NOCA